MPSRRRKTLTNKMTAEAAPETEEVRGPVTQVVEVIEVEEEKIPEAAVPIHEAPAEEPPVSEPTDEVPVPREDSSRKSMVEELYTKENTSRVMPEISVHKNKPVVSLFVWAAVTILVALITGGILFAAAKKTPSTKLIAQPTPTPKVSATAKPTPASATFDKTSFKIQVLNGGGTVGAAGKMRTFLEDKGYTVSGTGNTAEYTYTTTEIHGKTAMKDAIAHLKTDLTGTYTLGTVAADLTASAAADVQIIVGK